MRVILHTGMEEGNKPGKGCLQLLILFISTPWLSSAYLCSCEDVLSNVFHVYISVHVHLYIYIAPGRIRSAKWWGMFHQLRLGSFHLRCMQTASPFWVLFWFWGCPACVWRVFSIVGWLRCARDAHPIRVSKRFRDQFTLNWFLFSISKLEAWFSREPGVNPMG